jgi:T4 RnlA family RNA ligase
MENFFAKTIGSFTSEQSELAYNLLYTNEEHVLWVKEMLKTGCTPLFEYVSWDNRVVLKYSKAQIRFIGMRDNIAGAFISAPEIHDSFFPKDMQIVEEVSGTLDGLIEEAKTTQAKEGWVVKFTDGQLVKLKTAWYFKLHGLRTQDINREDYVIQNYLNETLDDIMTQLDPVEDADAYNFVSKVTRAIDNYIIHIDKTVQELVDEYNSPFYFGHWAKFATDKHRSAFFGLARTKIEQPENYQKKKKEIVLALTFHLKQAKQIVEKWKS